MTRKIHIAHVIYRFDTGGLENGVVNIINRLGEKQFHHSIITLDGCSEAFCQRINTTNVDFFDLAKKPGQDFGMFMRLRTLLKRIKPDVFHTRNIGTLECQLVGWWCRIPYRIHGEHGWDVNDLHGSNAKYRLLRRLIKPFVHQYIALSSEAKEYLEDKIGVATRRIVHLCNGVDADRFLPTKAADKNTTVIGCVGRLEEVKNHQLLIESIGVLAQQTEKPFVLQLVGDGSLRDKLQKRIEALEVTDKVEMLGNRNDVDKLMNRFDFFVLPSLAEGISNTILEAMACGLPVIATNVGGNGDLVVDTKTGYLVDAYDPQGLANKMQSYIDDPDTCQLHGSQSRQRIEQEFSLDVMVKKYHAIYTRNSKEV